MHRDRETWFAYCAQAVFGFMLYGSGPITALVRADLGLGYLAAGILPALFTGGAIGGAALTGWLLRGDVPTRREVRVLQGAAATIALGSLVMALPWFWAVAAGLGIAGVAGGTIPPAGALLLAKRHGELTGRALLEVNVLAAMAGVLAAGALSGAASAGSWRLALLAPGLAGFAAALVMTRHAPVVPPAAAAPAPLAARGRLTTAARWYVAVAICAGVVEFGVIYWAADLIANGTGLSATAASGTLVAFTGGLVAGRVGLSLLASSVAANRRILAGSLLLAAAGAVVLLLAGRPGVAVAALVLVGVGAAALYPVSLALAVAAAGRAGARASAVLSVGVGVSALVAPVLLAAGADAVGMRIAFVGVPLAALVGFLATVRAGRTWVGVQALDDHVLAGPEGG